MGKSSDVSIALKIILLISTVHQIKRLNHPVISQLADDTLPLKRS
jgi:hypothetical protein